MRIVKLHIIIKIRTLYSNNAFALQNQIHFIICFISQEWLQKDQQFRRSSADQHSFEISVYDHEYSNPNFSQNILVMMVAKGSKVHSIHVLIAQASTVTMTIFSHKTGS